MKMRIVRRAEFTDLPAFMKLRDYHRISAWALAAGAPPNATMARGEFGTLAFEWEEFVRSEDEGKQDD